VLSLDHLRFSSETPPNVIRQHEEGLLLLLLLLDGKYREVSEGRDEFEKKVVLVGVVTVPDREGEGIGDMFLRRGEIWARERIGAEAKNAVLSTTEGRRACTGAGADAAAVAAVFVIVGKVGEVGEEMEAEEMLELDLWVEEEEGDVRGIVRWSRLPAKLNPLLMLLQWLARLEGVKVEVEELMEVVRVGIVIAAVKSSAVGLLLLLLWYVEDEDWCLVGVV